MASPNTLRIRCGGRMISEKAEDGTVTTRPDLRTDTARVVMSGAGAALFMKAENEASKAWAHERPAEGTGYHGPRTRDMFRRQPDARKRVTAAADAIVEREKAKKL